MEIRSVVSVAKRWWWTLLLATFLAGTVGFWVASQAPQMYESRVRLLVGPVNTDHDTLRASGQLARTYAELATGEPVLQETVAALGAAYPYEGLEPLRLAIEPTADSATRVLILRVKDRDPELAATIADELGTQLARVAQRGETGEQGDVMVIDPASPGLPVGAGPYPLAAVAAIAGAIGTLTVILLLEFLNTSVRNEQELTQITGKRHLGSVSKRGKMARQAQQPLLVKAQPQSNRAADHRLLATKLDSVVRQEPVETLLLVGTRGVSSTGDIAANLAAVFAEQGRRVTLVDADSQGQEVTKLFELTENPGLKELFAYEDLGVSLEPFSAQVAAGLTVVPSGRTEEPSRDSVSQWLVQLLRSQADILIISGSPPESAPSLFWAREADATVLVIRREHTQQEELHKAMRSLEIVGANVVGTVFEEVRVKGWSTLRRILSSWRPGRMPRSGIQAPDGEPAPVALTHPRSVDEPAR